MSEKNKWKEKIETASTTNLFDFLPSQGLEIENKGNAYFVKGLSHDTIAILPNAPHMFKHFATGETNNSIVFCQNYLGMSLQTTAHCLKVL